MVKKLIVNFIRDAEHGKFITPTTRNNLDTQSKYEAAIANLCSCIGVTEVFVNNANDGNRYYKPNFTGAYFQTGASTLVLLSEELCRVLGKQIAIDTSPNGDLYK